MLHTTSSHNQKEDNKQFKNKEQLELPENHLHGGPTTKELKKHSSRLVGRAERTRGKAAAGRSRGQSHFHKLGGTTGE